MITYKNSLGITCIEPDEGYLLQKNGQIYKKVYLGINDRAELYSQVIDENYVFSETRPEEIDEHVESVKKELIKLNKNNLSRYLEFNPMFSTVKYKDGRYYSITLEKQNLLLTNISTYQMAKQEGLECILTWNDTGEECELWTYEELFQLAMEMRNHVAPIISLQQYTEVNINKCTTIDELNNIDVNFTKENIEAYKPIYYKKIGISHE